MIQDEILEMPNDSSKINEYFRMINSKLAEKNLELSHLVIDNQVVTNDYEHYFKKYITSINEVIVVVVSQVSLINETLESTEQYISNAITQITFLAEEFYQKPNKSSWIRIADLFEGIQWMLETVQRIDNIKNLNAKVMNYEIWNEYVQKVSNLSGVIRDIQEAINSKDNVSIGDLLLYEIIPAFESISNSLKFLITEGGNGHAG